MKVLFVTRKFPPSVGGMENAAYQLHKELVRQVDVEKVSWGGNNMLLPVIFPWLAIKSVYVALRRRPDVVYLQDGVLAPLVWLHKYLLRLPVVMTVHGLEATYDSAVYDLLITPAARRVDLVVAVSNETATRTKKWLGDTPIQVVNNGVEDVYYQKKTRAEWIEIIGNSLGRDLSDWNEKKIILTTGRLVPRKGVAWFIDKVMPTLRDTHRDILYVVVGTGPDAEYVREKAESRNVDHFIELLGRIPHEALKGLYNLADAFIMPNIKVRHDMEGFGLVALEAASCGTPVIASNIEGIKDAIIQGKNGHLVPAKDVEAYVAAIESVVYGAENKKKTGTRTRQYVLTHFTWEEVASQYVTQINELLADTKRTK